MAAARERHFREPLTGSTCSGETEHGMLVTKNNDGKSKGKNVASRCRRRFFCFYGPPKFSGIRQQASRTPIRGRLQIESKLWFTLTSEAPRILVPPGKVSWRSQVLIVLSGRNQGNTRHSPNLILRFGELSLFFFCLHSRSFSDVQTSRSLVSEFTPL